MQSLKLMMNIKLEMVNYSNVTSLICTCDPFVLHATVYLQVYSCTRGHHPVVGEVDRGRFCSLKVNLLESSSSILQRSHSI